MHALWFLVFTHHTLCFCLFVFVSTKVSWSSMTPFQLVTIAGDGLARLWDVREAALKRCKIIRNRADYIDDKMNQTRNADVDVDVDVNIASAAAHSTNQGGSETANDSSTSPPNADVGDESASAENQPNQPQEQQQQQQQQQEEENGGGIYVPPLPAGAEFGIGAEAALNNNNNNNQANAPQAGTFVANDEIDEGVVLISRLLHGDLNDSSQLEGAGTRSRRKKVKVLCLSRCPIGGHFATGSDDGIGRIWAEESNSTIEKLDQESRSRAGLDSHSWNGQNNFFQGQVRDSLQRTRSSSIGSNNGECWF